jgi:hypothetical protein
MLKSFIHLSKQLDYEYLFVYYNILELYKRKVFINNQFVHFA